MEQLKNIEQCLIGTVQGQMGDLKKVNAKEMGEVIDMIKDLEEAMYYCSIIEAMEKTNEKEEHSQAPMNISYYMEGGNGTGGGTHYYDGQSRNSDGQFTSTNNVRSYVPYMEYAPYMMRDKAWREGHLNYEDGGMSGNGRSYYSRRMYMEGKHNGADDQKSMKDLEHYMKDLADDMVEMINSSTPEEKQVLSNKLSQLAAKVIK